MVHARNFLILIALAACGAAVRSAAAPQARPPAPDEIEFFESRIRPLLAEKCYACHGPQAKAAFGGLRLDSREALLRGGDRGPVIVPGDPAASLLMRAVSYNDLDLKMPPSGRLSQSELDDLARWIRIGAPDPRAAPVVTSVPRAPAGLDLAKARSFWSLRPLTEPAAPPARPEGPVSPIDRFIRAALEAKGLRPAPPAPRPVWLRRVTFDLVGLPPTPDELADFERDASAQAFERVVERLLASPHYGERWGRHWLDLVRYAETNGHEFDNDKLDAWRYRDYVIRAFNLDLPYDRFVREQIAGDLLPGKRLSPDGSHWESPLGTTFYWFGEVLNSATDSVKSRADTVDNQLDVVGKTFLGLTVACARCHDHKFDPIPTADYYSLAGVMHSTDLVETVLDSPARAREIGAAHASISAFNGEISKLVVPMLDHLASRSGEYLLAAAGRPSPPGLHPGLVKAWTESLAAARDRPEHPLRPFASLAARGPASEFRSGVAAVRRELAALGTRASRVEGESVERGESAFEEFEGLDYGAWTAAGEAFGTRPRFELAPNQLLRGYLGEGMASSFGAGSDRLVGSLTSAKFRAPKLFLHVRMAGSKESHRSERAGLRVTLVADGHKSQHMFPDGSGAFTWSTVRLTKEIGRLCYFEIVDRSREGHLVVDRILFSDSKEPPGPGAGPNRRVLALLDRPDLDSLERLAAGYAELFRAARSPAQGDLDARQLAAALVPCGTLEELPSDDPGIQRMIEGIREKRAARENQVPPSTFAMVARDENPHDVRIHLRGNHKNLGSEVPRRFLEVLGGREQRPVLHGSGRLELADWVASPSNPLTFRVMANRIWKHHFGHGLVRSVDNFGAMGERPTHAELLEHLACRLRERGSIKALHREIVLSSTYRMSSRADAAAERVDPENRLLHHMPVHRLEAEALRDAMLAVSGRLDRSVFGPSIRPHISAHQDGRGKPESGPLDGDGRRSVYIQIRRNFIPPLFLAFDYPLPISTIGARSVSTVPSQALMLMNNELVASQAALWSRRLAQTEEDQLRRVTRAFLEAFARPPTADERRATLAFIQAQTSRQRGEAGSAPERAWADLCHVLLNSAEFLYVP
jgi:hypothetical protein